MSLLENKLTKIKKKSFSKGSPRYRVFPCYFKTDRPDEMKTAEAISAMAKRKGVPTATLIKAIVETEIEKQNTHKGGIK